MVVKNDEWINIYQNSKNQWYELNLAHYFIILIPFSSNYFASALLVQLLESLASCCAIISRKENIWLSNSLLITIYANSPISIFDLSCLNRVLISSYCSFRILAPTFFNLILISFLKSFLLGSSPKNQGCFLVSLILILVLGLGSNNIWIRSRLSKIYLWTLQKVCNDLKRSSKMIRSFLSLVPYSFYPYDL